MAEFLLKTGCDPHSARIAASLAGGSLKRGIEISAEDALSERNRLLDRIGSLSTRDIAPLFATAEELAGSKEKALETLDILVTYLRDILLMQGGSQEVVNARPPLPHRTECRPSSHPTKSWSGSAGFWKPATPSSATSTPGSRWKSCSCAWQTRRGALRPRRRAQGETPPPAIITIRGTPLEEVLAIRIVKIQFHTAGKLYDFNAGNMELKAGDKVIVETERGRSMATVVVAPVEVAEELVPEGLKSIMRKASAEDVEAVARNAVKEKEAYAFCLNRIKERGMAMKLVRVEYLYDGSKAIFYFTADGRVDFRELVKDLAHTFHTRIEMRQIGVRDEAKMVGGLGICGRELCCSSFLRDFEPVSVKMAKEQNLALNPTKISGQCGRLLCCLGYEFETYCTLRKCLPKCGKMVQKGEVKGEVVKLDLFSGTVTVKTDDAQEVVLKGDEIRPENITDRVKKPQKEQEKAPETELRKEAREPQPGSYKGRRDRRDKKSRPQANRQEVI